MLKNDCTALLSEEKLNKLYKKFGISKLEIELLMGNISREYEESYYEKVSVIASLLEKEKKEEKVKKLKEEFKTQKGKLYHADCLEILPGIKSETVDLIFADPPFNLKKEYANGRSDNLSVSLSHSRKT